MTSANFETSWAAANLAQTVVPVGVTTLQKTTSITPPDQNRCTRHMQTFFGKEITIDSPDFPLYNEVYGIVQYVLVTKRVTAETNWGRRIDRMLLAAVFEKAKNDVDGASWRHLLPTHGEMLALQILDENRSINTKWNVLFDDPKTEHLLSTTYFAAHPPEDDLADQLDDMTECGNETSSPELVAAPEPDPPYSERMLKLTPAEESLRLKKKKRRMLTSAKGTN